MITFFSETAAVWSRIRRHQLNARNSWPAISRFLRWQWHRRFHSPSMKIPFIGNTYLILRQGVYGATGNYYNGLNEFEPMCFLLHLLRAGDLFVDAGANIGAFTILASGLCKAHTCAIEPIPETYHHLLEHLTLNQIGSLVEAIPMGLAAKAGSLRFINNSSLQNRVATEGDRKETLIIQVSTLDEVLGSRTPILLKLDVEGYEGAVLAGAGSTLRQPQVQAIIIEMMELGKRYGFEDAQTHRHLTGLGFWPFQYEPFSRKLTPLLSFRAGENNLYIRSEESVAQRLRDAPPIQIHGHTI